MRRLTPTTRLFIRKLIKTNNEETSALYIIKHFAVNHFVTSGFTSQMASSAPDSRVHGANMWPTWVLSAPGGSHLDPMSLAIWGGYRFHVMMLSCTVEPYTDLNPHIKTLDELN